MIDWKEPREKEMSIDYFKDRFYFTATFVPDEKFMEIRVQVIHTYHLIIFPSACTDLTVLIQYYIQQCRKYCVLRRQQLSTGAVAIHAKR